MKFQIKNGFRDRVIRLWNMPRLRAGFPLFLGVVVAALIWVFGVGVAAGVSLGLAPMVSFNKDGLSGANLELVNDLEKRISLMPDAVRDQLVNGLIEGKLNERLASYKDVNVEELKKMLADGPEGVRAILKAQGEKLAQMEMQRSKDTELTLRTQIEKWTGVNKAAIDKIKSGEKAELSPLQLRVVASPMTPTNTLTSTVAANNAFISTFEREAGAIELIRVRPTFWDYIRKGRTSSKTYVWVNKKNPQGDAAFIAPGVAKPGVSFELAAETSVAKKIAESLKTATELLTDVDGMQSFISDELAYKLKAKANTTLGGSGAGDANTPKGLAAYGVAYSLVGIDPVASANNWDALRACVAQLRSGNFEGVITAFVNPVDKANMDMTKAVSQGQLFIPSPPGCDIVEDNNVTVGQIKIAILDFYRVLIYQDYTVTFGFENDDFTKNLITVIGELKVHQFVSENHAGFCIVDTFANVKAAIQMV